MNAKLYCNTSNLILDEGYVQGINQFFLVATSTIDGLYNSVNQPQILWGEVGGYFIRSLTTSPHFQGNIETHNIKDSLKIAGDSLALLSSFIDLLWFVKDNSYNVTTLAILGIDNTSCQVWSGHKNFNALGDTAPVKFEQEELIFASQIMNKLSTLNLNKEDNYNVSPSDYENNTGRVTKPQSLSQRRYNENNRIFRALTFLDKARRTSSLPEKISYYVLLLECLFSADDSTEIMHRIGERVALYIGDTLDSRFTIYTDIKKAYSIRSKYVHGQKLSSTQDKHQHQSDISLMLDNLIRLILVKVVNVDMAVFILEEEQLRTEFNKWVFDKPIIQSENDTQLPD